jgi:hypothetical protein
MKTGTGSTTCGIFASVHPRSLVVPQENFFPKGARLNQSQRIRAKTGLMKKGTGFTICCIFASVHLPKLVVPVPFFIRAVQDDRKLPMKD